MIRYGNLTANRRDHHRSCPLLMGKMVRARSGTRGRSRRGATIAEFALTLISLFLLIFFPCCNAVLFCTAYVSLDNINREAVESVAMSDTAELAERRTHELLTRYINPLLTLYQPVQLDPQSAAHLMIAVNQRDGDCQCYDAARGLPRDKQPGFKDNRSRLSYSYRLQVDCVIRPFFNLSSIPAVGQTAIIGRATQVSVSAMAPIENLGSLNSVDHSQGLNQKL
jgi:hypothetical protein